MSWTEPLPKRNGQAARGFRWVAGFEGSFIPQHNVDQYEWTQHNRFWREDFQRVSGELGCRWIRYPVPWHLLETRPGRVDWRWADERFELARTLGIHLMVDLVHFGTPAWLPDSFSDAEFPEALERFSRAFGKQFAGAVSSVCPINEPLVTALFCGDVGLWPPHLRGLKHYMTVLSRIAQAACRSARALRETMPGAELLICEAMERPTLAKEAGDWPDAATREAMERDLALRQQRRFAALDLITGRVRHDHPLRPWLLEHGFPEADLNWLVRNPASLDLLGLDYYGHSEMELYPVRNMEWRQRVPERLSGLYSAVKDYCNRYALPVMISETSACGSEEHRLRWLESTVADVRRLRAEGAPVVGCTWWPVIDHMDWDGAMLHQVGRIHPSGIYGLERKSNGVLERVPTALAPAFRKLCAEPETSAGELRQPGPVAPQTAFRSQDHHSASMGFPLIVHCHLRWEGVWQRPQQFLSRLSRNHPVLFAEGPILTEGDESPRYELQQAPGFPNVTVFVPFLPASRFSDGAWVDEQRRQLLRRAMGGPLGGLFDTSVQWFYDPMAIGAFLGMPGEQAVVYDCMDELSQFRFAPREIREREALLLSRADVVFTGGRRLCEVKSRSNANCHFYGCGVDTDHFARACDEATKLPTDIAFINRPILGYFGVVDERLDYTLIARLADANPEWSVVMIGPAAKIDPNDLPVRRNLYWLGRREYAQLPAYAKAFSVCLMPFALNEATEYINPTKALEYMGSARPVVSTAVPDVVANFAPVAAIGRTHEEFIELCRQAVDSPDAAAIRRGLEMARCNDWESIVAKLDQHVTEALERNREARAARPRWDAVPA